MQDHFWYEPKTRSGEKGPRFRVRAASLTERAEFDAELEGEHDAIAVAPFVMLDTAIAGVQHLLEGEDAGEVEELLRSYHSAASEAVKDGAAEEISTQDRQQVAEVEKVLLKNWPDYARLVGRNARYRNLMPLLALQRFVDSWENVTDREGEPVEYERDEKGNIPDHTLRRVAPVLIMAAGNRAYNFQYGIGEEKN